MAKIRFVRENCFGFTANHPTECKQKKVLPRHQCASTINKRCENSRGEKNLLSLLFTFHRAFEMHTKTCLHIYLSFFFLLSIFLLSRNQNKTIQPNELRNSPKDLPTFNDATRKFNGAKDVSRDFSISQDNTDRGSMSDQAFACSASSVESLPSASGSSELFLFQFIFFGFEKHKFIDLLWLCRCCYGRYPGIGSSRQSE